MTVSPILLLDNVSRVHGHAETAVRALDGVTLTVHTGELVAVTQSPVIVIPWLPLVGVCVGVPLLAAGLAWLAVRRHPQLTRRLA